MKPDESYVVKFWFTNAQGFKEQREETVFLYSKGKHKKAQEEIISKYRKAPYLQHIEIVSVTYQ